MRRLGAACVQRRQMGFEGAEVADSGGLEYGCGGGQAGQLGIHKLKVDDLGFCVFGQIVDVVGLIVDCERCHRFFLKKEYRWRRGGTTAPCHRDLPALLGL